MSTRLEVRSWVKPARLHWLTLAVGAVLLLFFNRHQWFSVDEWAWVVDRGILGSPVHGLLVPHNEHWSTAPIIIWRGVFAVFGVRTYTPYLLLMITAHLVTAHLLWRLLLRVGVDALVATIACVPFIVLGAGSENLMSAFQFSLITPLALGFGALLVIPDRGPFGSRDFVVVALLVFALMWSGVALTMVVVVGVFALLARGVKVALATVVPPALVYLLWYAGWGHDDTAGREADPLTTAIQRLPEFAWEGLTSTVDDITGLAGIGAAVLVLLGLFAVLRLRPSEPADARVLATAAGAVIFLLVTGIRRTSFGIETAGSGRYVYIVAALLLPLAALAFDRALRGRPMRWTIILAVTALVVMVQVTTLNQDTTHWGQIEQDQKHRIMATVPLARDDTDLNFLAITPAPSFSPDLTVPDIEQLADDDKLPGNVEVTESDRLSALTYLQVTLEADPRPRREESPPVVESVRGGDLVPSVNPGCFDVVPRSPNVTLGLRLPSPAPIRIAPGDDGSIAFALREGGVDGGTRELPVGGGIPGWLNVNVPGASMELTLKSMGLSTLCRIEVANA